MVCLEFRDSGYWTCWLNGVRHPGEVSLYMCLEKFRDWGPASTGNQQKFGPFVACGPILEWSE
jgi:hypothetical protein